MPLEASRGVSLTRRLTPALSLQRLQGCEATCAFILSLLDRSRQCCRQRADGAREAAACRRRGGGCNTDQQGGVDSAPVTRAGWQVGGGEGAHSPTISRQASA